MIQPLIHPLVQITLLHHYKTLGRMTLLLNATTVGKMFNQKRTTYTSLHTSCALIRPPLTIENLKSHDHALTLFPRQIPLPCDACGFSLDDPSDHVYSCLLCNYMVHRTCIYLPRVIKITRHPHHRLSFTSSIVPARELSCGVCRRTVDISYGSYTCNEGCPYALHSKCATKKQVWDGKDVEGVPEEEEEILEPFLWIDQKTMQHFSHDHHYLRLRWHGSIHGDEFCQACTLPMTVSDFFYSCIKCEFVLHYKCASLPRKKHHPVHKHPLTLLHPFSSTPHNYEEEEEEEGGFFRCNGCSRYCCGFMYKCMEEEGCDFRLDARCASLPDPSILDCHDHPLFFNFTTGSCMFSESNGCGYYHRTYLECIKCDDSFMCLHCATLPRMAHYMHDKHPVTLCYGEEEIADLKYWCEICEGKLDGTEWFYTCDSCRVTLHITCLLGKDLYYMKPNHSIKIKGQNVEIEYNNGTKRPVCKICRSLCIYTLVFKCEDGFLCSLFCLNGIRSDTEPEESGTECIEEVWDFIKTFEEAELELAD